MSRPQGVNVTGAIVPTDTADTYPVTNPFYQLGGMRTVTTTVVRNAIPTARREEGMLVYVKGDQILYQLAPPGQTGWVGTDADWVAFGNLQPYEAPSFATFEISGQPRLVANGTTIGGSVTFIWTDVFAFNIALNSISITDTTTSTVIASGLADTGSHSATIPTVTLGSPGSHVWTISATDVKGNAISMDYTITWFATSDKTYYVNNATGNDVNNGLSTGAAWATLQHAADTVLAGDTVHVAVGSGPYAGFVMGWNVEGVPSGTTSHPITFDFAAGATINHRNIHTFDAIDLEGNSYITIQGATITNDGSVTRFGIRCGGAPDGIGNYGFQALNNTISGCGRMGIESSFSNDALFQGNVISNILALGGATTGHGIYASNSCIRVTVRSNIIHDCGCNGIHFNGDVSAGGAGVAQQCLIERNILSNNGKTYGGAEINPDGIVNSIIQNNLIYEDAPNNLAGITLYRSDAAAGSTGNIVRNNTVIINSSGKAAIEINSGSTGNTLFNNFIYNKVNGGAANGWGTIAIDISSLDGFVSDYNILSGSFSFDNGESWVGLSSWQAATGGDSHSSVLPSLAGLFTNTGSGDYHLAVASPLIDAGAATVNSLAAPTADLDNEPRPDGSGYDVGCYEFNPALPAIVAKNPAAGASGVVVPAVSCTFNHGVTSGSIVFVVKDSGGTSVAGSTSYDSGSFIATWTPASPLAVSSLFTASVSGATDSGSHVMAGTVSWSFTTAPAPAVVAVSPTSGAAFIGATTAPTVQYDVPIAMAPTVTLTPSGGSPVSGSLSYNAGTDTFTFTPSSSLSASTVYTLVSSGAVDAAGNVQPSPFSSTFTTAAAAAETLFGDATPGTDDHDQGAVNGASYIGVRFKSSVAGQVLSLGFYKGANNAGTHVGWLYSVDQTTGDVGTQLATVTFSGETSSGWQWQNLGSPITLTSNTIYMAVVQCPNQHMSLDNSYFTVDRSNGSHLTGVADLSGSSGPPNGTMTTHSYDVANASAQAAANWYVDVRFQS